MKAAFGAGVSGSQSADRQFELFDNCRGKCEPKWIEGREEKNDQMEVFYLSALSHLRVDLMVSVAAFGN